MEQACSFCGSSSQEDVLGPFYRLNKHRFHSNCLVFAGDIRQNAHKPDELYGPRRKNIELALHRGRNRICIFCQHKGATVMCDEETCNATFHLTCAIESKQTLHLNFNQFRSYCSSHIPYKCIFDFEPVVGIYSNKSRCCQQIYSHDECIKKYVQQAKASSKCPICFDEEIFKKSIETTFDLIISNRKASYARRQNSTYDLQCASDECTCNKGRFYHKEYSDYELITCEYCGSNAIHKLCGKVEKTWICGACDPESDLRSEAYGHSSSSVEMKNRKRKLENLRTYKRIAGGKHLPSFESADRIKNNTFMPQHFGVNFKITVPRLR